MRVKKYSDNEIVEVYLQYQSQNKAAEVLGIGRETVARTVRSQGIKLTGRKNNGKNQPQTKITDSQLIEATKTMNCVEIARMYDMSAERVYRRARKLGLNVNSVGGGGHYHRRQSNIGKASEYDEGVTLKKVRAKYHDICQICGLMVDDTAIVNGHIKRLYPTIDHIIPLSKGGTHTWENVRLAHMSCNAGKRDKND